MFNFLLELSEGVTLNFIILGAGKPYVGDLNTAIQPIDTSDRILDWTLRTVSSLAKTVTYVGGYQADEIRKGYPELTFCLNADWQATYSGWSLLLGLLKSNVATLVSYSDILFRQSIVHQMLAIDSDIVLGVDKQWQTRFVGRTQRDLDGCEKVHFKGEHVHSLGNEISEEDASAEFIGLALFSAKAVKALKSLKASAEPSFLRQVKLPALV